MKVWALALVLFRSLALAPESAQVHRREPGFPVRFLSQLVAMVLRVASRAAHHPRKAPELLSVLPIRDAEHLVQVQGREVEAMGDLPGWKVRVPQGQEEQSQELVVESTSLEAVRLEPMKVSKSRVF